MRDFMILVLKTLLITHTTHYLSQTSNLNRYDNVSSGTDTVGWTNCIDVVKSTYLNDIVDHEELCNIKTWFSLNQKIVIYIIAAYFMKRKELFVKKKVNLIKI